ncbi:MAG: Dabb family protein [Deltaproteobacteria bacterium]|nr:Dabb family protein [Deltaproteobacteria bacterium]
MLKHVVFFKFKDGVGEEEIVNLEKSLAALSPVIPEILSYEFGRDVVRSERSYDLALVSAFKDLDAMQHYQKHPDHQVVLKKVNDLCKSVLAVDFVTE